MLSKADQTREVAVGELRVKIYEWGSQRSGRWRAYEIFGTNGFNE